MARIYRINRDGGAVLNHLEPHGPKRTGVKCIQMRALKTTPEDPRNAAGSVLKHGENTVYN